MVGKKAWGQWQMWSPAIWEAEAESLEPMNGTAQ